MIPSMIRYDRQDIHNLKLKQKKLIFMIFYWAEVVRKFLYTEELKANFPTNNTLGDLKNPYWNRYNNTLVASGSYPQDLHCAALWEFNLHNI